MRVLVTGGAGYIGSHTVRELLDDGHEVTILDDLSAGHRYSVPAAARLVEGDIANRRVVDEAMDGAAVVFHFAGLLSVGESVREPGKYYRANVASALTLLESMREKGTSKFVFSSSCATYGMPVTVPMDESHPQDPINPYGSSKLVFERVLQDYARAGKLRAVALRYFNAAGCHPDGTLGEDHAPEEHLIPLAIDAALGRRPPLTVFGEDYDTPDGTCIRDYIHVSDLARAHVLALGVLDKGEPFEAFNLGTETGTSVREVIDSVARVSGRTVPFGVGPRRPGDPPRLVAAATRSRSRLGFAPRFDTIDAIVETAWKWREGHPGGYHADRR